MEKINYYFVRRKFDNPDVKPPFYEYRGYFFKNRDGRKHYPVFIHFGMNELSVCFKDFGSGKIHKVFVLYVAEGELNQKKLSSQVENYWKMPVWPLSKSIKVNWAAKENEDSEFYCETGALCKYMGIDITDDNKFLKNKLFKESEKKDYKIYSNPSKIEFFHKKESEKNVTELWIADEFGISTNKINFRKILLDFLFELEFANTFEDKNYFQLQKVLQNNRPLDALTRKLCYIIELYKLKDYEQASNSFALTRKFKYAEKQWLNICFLNEYKDVFEARNSIFKSPEEEAKNVLFKTQIGNSKKKSRSDVFIKEDETLRNHAASFFLKQYSIYDAFRALLPTFAIWLIPAVLLLIPFGDFFIKIISNEGSSNLVGITSICLPSIILIGIIYHYIMTDINLFKLLLPRMFLGIMLGWSVFWGTEELWKSALTTSASDIVWTSLILFVLIFLYIYTDIQNKLYKAEKRKVLSRTIGLLVFAIIISFVQGFYVLQFKAKPMLENSQFLNNPKISKSADLNDYVKDDIKILDYAAEQMERKLGPFKNFYSIETFTGRKLYYIWSIHFSQLMMSILIGIVLQLLWEDRPITEPL